MRILITGAGGFVGGHLIRHLCAAEPTCEIIGTLNPGRSKSTAMSGSVRFVPCDIIAEQGETVAALVRDVKPDRLYHLAGMASGASADQAAVFQVNVDGTRNVLRAAQGIVDPRHIVFVSTGYVYGNCDPLRPAREDDPSQPARIIGLYAASKTAAEEVVREHGGAIIARAFNHTGPGQTTAFSVPAFASQIVQIERGRLDALNVGNMDARRDFLDVRDVVRAYHDLAELGTAGETYNVCSGDAIRMGDLLDQLRALACVEVPVTTDPNRMRPADIAVSVGDPHALETLSGWRPEIPFSQTLQDVISFWRRQT